MKKKIKTAKALLKEINLHLANKEGWSTDVQAILSVLRGPDDQAGDNLKYLTIARIRAIVAPAYIGAKNHLPLTGDQRAERNKLLADGNTHFRCHYAAAVTAIKSIYNYNLEFERLWKSKK